MKKPKQSDLDAVSVREFLVEKFLLDGEDRTVQEIGASLGWNDTRVRRSLEDEHGFAEGLVSRKDVRTSRNSGGVHSVNLYGPDRTLLREYIARLERAAIAACGHALAVSLAPLENA